MKRRGVTLLELLVVVSMVAMITIGAAAAFSVGVDFQTRVLPDRDRRIALQDFERQLAEMIGQAFVAEDDDTFFLMGTAGAGSGTSTGELEESLTFTRLGMVSGAALDSQDDFLAANEALGPQGGLIETHLSTTPYLATGDRQGLFLREQRPADGDETQGGFERLMNGEIASVTFEAFDGIQWTDVWDTTAQDPPRLPPIVRVTYTLRSDEENPRSILVRIPRSDVTPENPLAAGGGAP